MQWFARMVARFSTWLTRVTRPEEVAAGHGWQLYFDLKKEHEKLCLHGWQYPGTREFLERFFATVEGEYTADQIESARRRLQQVTSN